MSGKIGWVLGRPRSEESKAKMAAAMRAKWQDPVYREQQTARLRTQQAKANRALRAAVALKFPKGTPEYRQYKKLRDIIGAAAARAAL
jgi:hypothetical protein